MSLQILQKYFHQYRHGIPFIQAIDHAFKKLIPGPHAKQLAAASDSVGQKFFGFQEDKRSANAFLEIAKGNAPFERMNNELKERDAKIEEMQSQIEALNKMMTKAKN